MSVEYEYEEAYEEYEDEDDYDYQTAAYYLELEQWYEQQDGEQADVSSSDPSPSEDDQEYEEDYDSDSESGNSDSDHIYFEYYQSSEHDEFEEPRDVYPSNDEDDGDDCWDEEIFNPNHSYGFTQVPLPYHIPIPTPDSTPQLPDRRMTPEPGWIQQVADLREVEYSDESDNEDFQPVERLHGGIWCPHCGQGGCWKAERRAWQARASPSVFAHERYINVGDWCRCCLTRLI